MDDLLYACRERFGRAPRRFSLMERLSYLWLHRPEWIQHYSGDGLINVFRHADEVFRNGTVVWGMFVQANSLLMQPGSDDLPADLLYSLEDDDVLPVELQDVGRAIFQLKGQTPSDPELRPLTAHMTGEMSRVLGMTVPSSISGPLRCRLSTTHVARKHLPDGQIRLPCLPIVVNPCSPFVALPLPARFWPEAMLEMWTP
ncbi:MAG: hypothetical protein AAGI68_09965 [Planctomycetota bacterium]